MDASAEANLTGTTEITTVKELRINILGFLIFPSSLERTTNFQSHLKSVMARRLKIHFFIHFGHVINGVKARSGETWLGARNEA